MLIFGAGKLPQVAGSLDMGVKEFKQEAIAPLDPAAVNPSASGESTHSARV